MVLDFAASYTTAALGKTGTVGRLESVDWVEHVEQIGLVGTIADSMVESVPHDSQAVASSF